MDLACWPPLHIADGLLDDVSIFLVVSSHGPRFHCDAIDIYRYFALHAPPPLPELSAADPIPYMNWPGGESRLQFDLGADDGLTQASDLIYPPTKSGEIVAEGDVAGIITPFITLYSIDIDMVDHVIQGSFAPGFDYTLTIDRMSLDHLRWRGPADCRYVYGHE